MFVFENGEAIDRENDARIKKIHRFYDGADPSYYEYKMIFHEKEYLLNVSFYYEPITYKDNSGKIYTSRVVFAVYVIEGDLKNSVASTRKKSGLPTITDSEYLELRRMVVEGLFCLETRGKGEETLKRIPGFHVDFVDTVKQVPPSKPLDSVLREPHHG